MLMVYRMIGLAMADVVCFGASKLRSAHQSPSSPRFRGFQLKTQRHNPDPEKPFVHHHTDYCALSPLYIDYESAFPAYPMSGVEIAGFVLAGFPLLISAGEHYREGFEPLVKWKRFRTDFIGFIDAVDIEKQLFDQLLERFLISVDVPYEEVQLFMTNRDYEGWHREDLVVALQARLGPSYDVYMSTIKTMDSLMHELEELLSLKNGEVGAQDPLTSSGS
jgi:hypothetical protein